MRGWTTGAMAMRAAALAVAVCLAGCVASSADKGAAVGTGTTGTAAVSSYAEPTGSAASTASARASGGGSSIPVSNATASADAASEARIATAAGTPGSDGYRVGALDVLTISVFKVDDLSKTVQVSESGKFSFPLIGEVQASGKTVSEIEKTIAGQLETNYLRNPQVTVLVKEYNSHRITVEGAVKKPGVFPMQGPMSMLQAIASSGGLNEDSDGTVLLFRKVDGRTGVVRFSMNDLRQQKTEDPDLQPGDIVMVPSSDLKVGMRYLLQTAPIARSFLLL